MSDTSKEILQQAYTLIENGEREKAQEILAPLLQDDADNVHLWWVYTHAVQDASMGLAALERVLELDPKYPGARELKADVLAAQSKDPDLIALEAGGSGAPGSASLNDVDDWEDLQPDIESDETGSSFRGRFVMVVILLIIIAGGGLVLSGAIDLSELFTGILPSPEPQVIVVSEATTEPTATSLEGEATEAPQAASATAESLAETRPQETADSDGEAMAPATEQEPTAVATEQEPRAVATERPTATATPKASPTVTPTISSDSIRIASFVSSVAETISGFTIVPLESGMLPTRLGDTLVIIVCAIPGPEFNQRLSTVLTTVVSLEADLPEEVEAVAAGLVNCADDEAELRFVGVTRATINAFANEEIDSKDFQRAWQPLS